MSEFLLEILSEEIPARMQAGAREQLEQALRGGLEKSDIPFSSLHVFITPRRMTAILQGLPKEQAPFEEIKKGPKTDAPEMARAGFLKSCGPESLIYEEEVPGKGLFLWAKVKHPGQKTADVLKGLVEEILQTFAWPKSMAWGDAPFTWVRPIHNILALFDGSLLGLKAPHPYITTIAESTGHRFLGSPFAVGDATDYQGKLLDGFVMLDQDQRRAKILQDLTAEAQKRGGTLVEDEKLLEEVTGLVEWPVVMSGTIEGAFLKLPEEVLRTSMRLHQKYFAARDAKGALLPWFFFVANMPPQGSQIVDGNQRVLAARLSDARFFFEEDQKKPLESYNAKLKAQLFHKDLGTVFEKTQRLQRLSSYLLPGNKTLAAACALSKADLATGMVGEFPELQGIMGSYYVKDQAIAPALKTQYLPQSPTDDLPQGEVPLALALLDKIDTLVCFFAVGIHPTGSKDPYALRRSALGILRLVFQMPFLVDLKALWKEAYEALVAPKKLPWNDVEKALSQFMLERLLPYFKAQGYSHGMVMAAFATEDALSHLQERETLLKALQKFVGQPMGQSIIQSYVRASGILGNHGPKVLEAALLSAPEERALFAAIQTLQQKLPALQGKWEDAFAAITEIQGPLNAFFENILVMDPDSRIQNNRLALLQQLKETLLGVCDFSLPF